MKIHDFIQGSPEWLAHRTTTYNASDAPAMLGCSPYQTRTALLDRLVTGISPEVDAETQRRFDDGHRFEALARPLAVDVLGEGLSPVNGSEDYGLELPLGASLDGSTITDECMWEHKSLNNDLRSILPETGVGSYQVGAALRKDYRVQMEHQLMVNRDADKVLFSASLWQQENGDWFCVEIRHCWYKSDPALRAEILAGWKQIEIDKKTHTPKGASAIEKIVAEPVQALPAVAVQVEGSIVVRDNFKSFETALRDFLENRLIREPKTDQDFADLEVQIKAMKGAEEALKAAEGQMLAQVQSIDLAKKTKDTLAALVRDNRLMAEKLLASEKERRKGEIVAVGVKGLADHIAGLNQRLGKAYMPTIPSDFGGTVRGMKSLASMEDKIATELARVKVAASEVADKIERNLRWLREHAADFAHLFADTGTLVLKAHDDFVAVAQNRITTEQQRVQAERDRIREEAAEAARKQIIDEQAAREAQAKSQQQATAAPAVAPVAAPAIVPVAAPIRVSPVPAAANDSARMKLGDIQARIAPLSITADGLAELGFEPVSMGRSSKLYRASDWPAICDALIQHLNQAHDLQQVA